MSVGAELMQTVGLQLRAGARVLVTGLDWVILPGQCWCVIGRNGAGKSTLLLTLAGMRAPHAGTVQLKGHSLSDWALPALARERAFLPQGRSDAFGYRVIEAILTARHPYHAGGYDRIARKDQQNKDPGSLQNNRQGSYWDSDDDYRAAQAALQALDVADLAERDIRTLSGGERQRVAIAAVLAQDTPLLLLDEPANALDLGHQVGVMDLLARLCRQSEKTVVMVGHDLNLAHSVASHALLLMGEGHWRAGPVAEMMQAPLLSACLGHPIEAAQHGEQLIFIPKRMAT